MADGQIDILIRLIADVTGAKITEEQIATIKEKNSGLNDALAKTKAESGGAADAIRDIIPALAGVMSVGGQIGEIARLEREAALAAAQWEEKILGIGAILANTNQMGAEQIRLAQELAGAYEKRTTVAAGKWLDVESTLLRIGKVRMEDMDREIHQVENLAGLTGRDLTEAALLYSRALNGNFTLLERVLPDLKDYQTTGEKLVELQRDLARGEGELEEQGKGAAGATRSLANATDELFRTLGKADTGSWKRAIADLFHDAATVLGGPAITLATDQVRHLTDSLTTAGTSGKEMGEHIAEGAKTADDAVKNLLDDLDRLQEMQDRLTDAQMAAEISKAKLLGEQAKLALPGDDKEGRQHIDDQIVIASDQIREKYKEKKLGDEREILQAKLHTLDEETRKSSDVISAADEARKGKESIYSDVSAELVKSISQLHTLGVNISPSAALGDLDALYGQLQGIEKAALPGSQVKEIAGYAQLQVKATDIAKKNALAAGATEDTVSGEQGGVIAALQQQIQDVRNKLQVNSIDRVTVGSDAQADIFKREAAAKGRDRSGDAAAPSSASGGGGGRHYNPNTGQWEDNSTPGRHFNPATSQWEDDSAQKRAYNPRTGNYEDVAAPAGEQGHGAIISQEKQTSAQKEVYDALDKTLETNLGLHEKTTKALHAHEQRLKALDRDVDNLGHQINSTRSR